MELKQMDQNSAIYQINRHGQSDKQDITAADTAMINAYIDKRLSNELTKVLEAKVLSNPELEKLFDQKLNERDILLQMIPDQRPSLNTLSQIKNEIRDLNSSVLEEPRGSWWQKLWNWLNTPFLEI